MLTADELEDANATLVRLRDAVWAIRNDRLRTARLRRRARRHATPAPRRSPATSPSSRRSPRSTGSRCAAATPPACTSSSGTTACPTTIRPCAALLAGRNDNPLFLDGSVRVAGECLSFVYKAAAEIGELGDNTRALRASIMADDLLRLALAAPGRPADPARPHPLGQRRHHQRSRTAIRSTARRSRVGSYDAPVRTSSAR